jgi:hypothetical protein
MRAPAFLCLALSLAAALALTACGGEAAQPKAPFAVSPAPPELAALVVRIPRAKHDDALATGVRNALEAQLIRAGYKIAADGSPFDLDLDPQLSSQRLPSMFHGPGRRGRSRAAGGATDALAARRRLRQSAGAEGRSRRETHGG